MDVFEKPDSVDADIMKNLGPFAPLAGSWEGDKRILGTQYITIDN